MPSSRPSDIRARACAVALAAVVVVAGCGSDTVKSAKPEKALNAELKKQGLPVRVDCPAKVSTSAEFDCAVTSTKNKTTRRLKFELTGKRDQALDVADRKGFKKALLASGS